MLSCCLSHPSRKQPDKRLTKLQPRKAETSFGPFFNMMTTNNQSIVKKSEENLAETIKEITIIVNKSPAVATSSSDVKFSSTNSNKKVKIDKKQSMRRTLELPPKIVSNHETTNKSSRVAEMVKELEKQEKRKRSVCLLIIDNACFIHVLSAFSLKNRCSHSHLRLFIFTFTGERWSLDRKKSEREREETRYRKGGKWCC